jgi:hypothetical protein
MKTRIALAILFCAVGASAALAGEAAGVKMPDAATIEGKTLKLNGIGLRKKMLFKVYVAGLYVETPSKDAATLISSDEVRSITLHILRSLSGNEIGEAISDGFWHNSKAQMGALTDRLRSSSRCSPPSSKGTRSS